MAVSVIRAHTLTHTGWLLLDARSARVDACLPRSTAGGNQNPCELTAAVAAAADYSFRIYGAISFCARRISFAPAFCLFSCSIFCFIFLWFIFAYKTVAIIKLYNFTSN